jgi:hypothetical protein
MHISQPMKLILIILEIYAGGCVLLMLLVFCGSRLRNEPMFDEGMKWILLFAIFWPLFALVPLFWICELLALVPLFFRERSEYRRLVRLAENADRKKSVNIEAGNT